MLKANLSSVSVTLARDEPQLYRRRPVPIRLRPPKKRGVGLGLYTCREVVRANGGTIEVNSEEGVGTTFLVVLPSARTDKAAKISCVLK